MKRELAEAATAAPDPVSGNNYDEELNTLKERAAYFELDKTKDFDEFKRKYINAVDNLEKVGYNINSPIERNKNGRGNANAISILGKELNSLNGYDSKVVVKKSDVKMTDLSALTAVTGDEFAMFTSKGKRLLIRGNSNSVNINADRAKQLQKQGYKWSGHTHPGLSEFNLIPSDGDRLILRCFNQKLSVVYNSKEQYLTFDGR